MIIIIIVIVVIVVVIIIATVIIISVICNASSHMLLIMFIFTEADSGFSWDISCFIIKRPGDITLKRNMYVLSLYIHPLLPNHSLIS